MTSRPPSAYGRHLDRLANGYAALRGGLAAVRTVDPAGCERFWLAPLFPSYVAIDSARFPPPALLADELVAADFESARAEPSPLVLRYPRERALELLHGRFASSFAL